MKLKVPTRPLVANEERLSKVRSMLYNFRKQALTPADHHFISSWLDESESNQQLFEKWIIEPRTMDAAMRDQPEPDAAATLATGTVRWWLTALLLAALAALA